MAVIASQMAACSPEKQVTMSGTLYSLDVLGVEDRGESSQLDVHTEFVENISRQADGRYKVNVPWIPGRKLAETNETQSRQRLQRVEKKLEQDMKLKEEYEKIVATQNESGIIERVPECPTGDRVLHATQASDQGRCSHYKSQDGVRCKRETSLPGEQY